MIYYGVCMQAIFKAVSSKLALRDIKFTGCTILLRDND
jgi:hypothetical protein